MTYASEVLADSPLVYWRLGEASGTTATDSSGNGLNGTYSGSYTQGVTGLLTGDSDTAVTFTSGLVTVADTTDLSALTAEAWIKGADTGGGVVARMSTTTTNRVFSLGLNAGVAQAVIYKTNTTLTSVTGTTTVSNNAVHHIAMTYDGTTLRLFVDGVEEGTPSTAVSGTLNTADGPLTAGGRGTSGEYSGTVDEVAYYTTALTDTRIAAHYSAGVTAAANEVNLAATIPSIVGGLTLDTGDLSNEVNFDAQMPSITGGLSLLRQREVHLDATLPALTGGLVLDNGETSAVRFDATMPSIEGSVALQGAAAESAVNRAGGWVRNNIGEAQWSPPVVVPTVAVEPQNVVVAQAYDTPTVSGTQVAVAPTYVREPEHRTRIVIAGRDVSYFRGVPTPVPDWQLIQPLLWGAATIELPQVAVPFEQPGHGALSWLKPGASVVIQSVDNDTNEVVSTDYRGLVIAFDINGGNLTVECGGHASGRAALIDRQMRLIQQRVDAGTLCARAIKQIRLHHNPPLRQTTGIELIDWGGGGMLDYINELVSKMATVDGDQYTIMPDENAVYRTTLKDLDTIHGTIYPDDARVKASLRRDIAEEPNRIFASGVTPNGMVVKFGAYPGLIQAPAPDYPFNDNATFGVGTTDADTDTGEGITVMGWRLFTAGYLEGQASYSTFTSAMAAAIRDLRRDAGLANTGDMNPAAWRALFDLSITGYDLRNIRILPAAQDSATKPWRLSASGGLIDRNPSYDPSVIWVDRTIAMGAGFTKSQIRQWARLALHDGAVWRGTIEVNTGAIVAGDHTPGDPVTSILRAREFQPGHNYSMPLFAGGIVVHVAGVSYTNGGKTATIAVSTQPGDTLPVWAAIQRDRENRNTVHRSFNRQRRSSDFERENTFDEVGGIIRPVALNADNWTVFPVVAKQAGTIDELRLTLSPAREFVVAVFARRITPARLRRVTNAPLSPSGRARWTEEAVFNALDRDYKVVYVAGSDEDPCGYFPGRKSDGASLMTGRWEDRSGFPFVTYSNDTDRGSVLWVAVWVGASATVQGGRIMWPSAEEY